MSNPNQQSAQTPTLAEITTAIQTLADRLSHLESVPAVMRSLSDRLGNLENANSTPPTVSSVPPVPPVPSSTSTIQLPVASAIKVALPDKFDGNCNAFRHFAASLDNFLVLKSASYHSDEIKVRFVGTLLSKDALAWFSGLVNGESPLLKDWKEFMAAFQELFDNPNAQKQAQSSIQRLKQGKGSVLSYSSRFRTLQRDTGYNDEALISIFRRGLQDQVQDILATSLTEPTDLEQFINLSIKIDNRLYSRRMEKGSASVPSSNSNQQSSKSASSSSPNDPMDLGAVTRASNGKLTKEERDRRFKENLCLYCGDSNHKISDCKKSQSKKTGGNSIAVLAPNSVEDSGPIVMQVSLLLGNGNIIQTRALVDSGATANFIHPDILKLRGEADLLDSSLQFKLANGESVTTDRGLNNVLVQATGKDESQSEVRTDFLVMNVSYPVILGLPWFQEAMPVIDWQSRTVVFREENSLMVIHPIQESTLPDGVPEDYSKFFKLFRASENVNLPEHRFYDLEINLKENSLQPPYLPMYQLSRKEQEHLKTFIDENLGKGYIRPSSSPSAAPIFFVPKKDGSLRPCIDYRKLNANTILDAHPLPLIDQILGQLTGAKFFTSLDLRGAYNLIRMKEGHEWKAAFRCQYGHFEPLVVQFGLVNAPACFQRFMNSIFFDMLDVSVVIYLDDILIFSKTLAEHKNHVKRVLQRLLDNNLVLKASKCHFHENKVHFLGFVVSGEGISMDPSKTDIIKNFPRPYSVKQLRSFLGFSNFYRRFIKDYSQIAVPLTRMTSKDVPFQWTEGCSNSFLLLKKALLEQVVLPFPNTTCPFFLHTDASDYALGGVLSQKDKDGQLRPIEFYSRKFTAPELNYSVYDKELLSIIECLKHWRHLLISPVSPTTIHTDHRNLLYFTVARNLKPRHARWAEFLSEFPFTIEFVSGASNPVADALSRPPERDHTLSKKKENALVVLPLDKEPLDKEPNHSLASFSLLSITKKDWPEDVAYFLHNDVWPDGLSEEELEFLNDELKNFTVKNDKLYRVNNKELKLYRPRDQREGIIKTYHEYLGHLATNSIIDLIERRSWWPNLKGDLKDYISRCPQCQLSKHSSTVSAPLRPVPSVALPFERWGLDFVQNLPKTKSGNCHIITAIDYATRWIVAKAVKEMTQETVIQFLYENILINYGSPYEIITDRGKQFLADAVKEFEQRQAIDHHPTTPYHPQTNGMVERMHAMLGHSITTLSESKPERWDEFLLQTIFAIRVRTHAVTRHSPFYLLYGVAPRLPLDPRPPPCTMKPLDDLELEEFKSKFTARELDNLGQHRAAAYHRSKLQAEQMKKRLNLDPTAPDHYFEEGDMVKMKHHDKLKFEFKWKGPYHVVKLAHPGTYWLMTPRGDWLQSTINQRDLAPWRSATIDNQDYFFDDTTKVSSPPAPNPKKVSFTGVGE